MRTFRLATPADIPDLAQLALDANQVDAELPDLAFVAEQDGRIVAAVGIELQHVGMVVLSGGVIHPDFYRKPFLAFRLQEAIEDWLISNKCFAYVFSVSKRNTRMQRWVEKLGAKRYVKKHGALWYVRTIGPKRDALNEVAA
jgi:acetyltransferase (GNAT) family protein